MGDFFFFPCFLLEDSLEASLLLINELFNWGLCLWQVKDVKRSLGYLAEPWEPFLWEDMRSDQRGVFNTLDL